MKKKQWMTGVAVLAVVIVGIGLALWPSIQGISGAKPESSSEMVDKLFSKIEKVQTYFVEERLKKALGLSEVQADTLLSILKDSNRKRAEVIRRKVAIVDQLERDNLQGESLHAALEEMGRLDHQFFALEQDKNDQLKQVLSDEQSAKFLVLRRQFVRKVIDVIKPLL